MRIGKERIEEERERGEEQERWGIERMERRPQREREEGGRRENRGKEQMEYRSIFTF